MRVSNLSTLESYMDISMERLQNALSAGQRVGELIGATLRVALQGVELSVRLSAQRHSALSLGWGS